MSDPIVPPDAGDAVVVEGDCLERLRDLPADSVHAVVTDPPYGLGFMGREWDRPGLPDDVDADRRQPYRFQRWCEAWAAECYRILRPGGHLLAFGGTRTAHRLASGIEDAGFEIRDTIAYLYLSGFPKSLDVGKAIDARLGAERTPGPATNTDCADLRAGRPCRGHGDAGQRQSGETVHATPTAPATADAAEWDGWGTALKPAHEPIVVARKPLEGTVAGTVLKWATGALNIDGCRVAVAADDPVHGAVWTVRDGGPATMNVQPGQDGTRRPATAGTLGRWPANVALDPAAADALDAQSGDRSTSSPDEVGAGSGRSSRENGTSEWDVGGTLTVAYGDTGGASRMLYVAKPSRAERDAGLPAGNDHPTVKPATLLRWLVRLVTPPGGIVVDPFAGSGTTGIAAVCEGMRGVLIERDADYAAIARARIEHARRYPGEFDPDPDARAAARRAREADEARRAAGQPALFDEDAG